MDGVSAIVCNGHAGEVSSLDREERRRALALAVDEVGDRVELISGIYTDNTLEAAELAKDAKAEGASGLLIFPPTLFMWGARLRPEMAVTHFETIAEATDLPLIVFEYPPASGIGYAPETLARLAEIEHVVGVKDWSNDMVALEAMWTCGRCVAPAGPWPCLAATPCRSSEATCWARTAPSLGWEASPRICTRNSSARCPGRRPGSRPRRSTTAWPRWSRCSTRHAFVDMHNRMKEALALLGRIEKAVVRPPLQRISDDERERIRRALLQSGLLLP